ADATGRYTTGFFWGNNFWSGSKSLCEQLDVNATMEDAVPFRREHRLSLDLELLGSKSHTFVHSWIDYLMRRFASVGIRNGSRKILMGLCLPSSCRDKDVLTLLKVAQRNSASEPRAVQVIDVKIPHHSYAIWQDTTFWILFIVTGFVAGMIFIGTTYDLYLIHKSKHFFSENYTYEISRASPPRLGETDVKLDIGNFTQTTTPSPTGGIVNHGMKCSTRDLTESMNTISSTTDSSQTSNKQGVITQVLLSFSVRLNLMAICDQSVGSDTLPTIHGLRSITMGWVILGHTCFTMFKYSDNMEYRRVVEKQFLFQTLNNAPFSVDTFFFISGLLVSFLYFRTISRINISELTHTTGMLSNVLQYLGLIAYRFGRLTVPYMYVLGVNELVMKWIHYNAVFEDVTEDHETCPKYWWRNAMYINTLFPVKEMCMLWSWYLSDDTQFYLLGCVLLILAVKHFKVAAVFLVIFLFSSWCTTAFIAYDNNHIPNVDDPLALFDKIYDKPWTRLGPYLIGMLVGWILYKTECKIHMNKVTVVVGWLVSLGGLFALVYGLHGIRLHPVVAAAYSSLSHSLWAIALSWIVIACSTGHGGYINKLLSNTLLYPFSRVTYCAYLVHPIIIRTMVLRPDSPVHLNTQVVGIIFFGQAVAAYILSFIVSLMFEAPVVSLLKILNPEETEETLMKLTM
ncbi:hypothetical protein L9F63_019376, partial [Diploptera punctata]